MNMSGKMRGLVAVCGLCVLAACVTGSILDSYDAIRGTATITEVRKSQYDPNPGVSHYVDVYFDFAPADAAARDRYRHRKWQDSNVRLCVNHRCDLVKSWVDAQGMRPGKTYPAVRYERKGGSGSMPPVFFEIPGFERDHAR